MTFALRLYNCYNHAHAPGQHMWPRPGRLPTPHASRIVRLLLMPVRAWVPAHRHLLVPAVRPGQICIRVSGALSTCPANSNAQQGSGSASYQQYMFPSQDKYVLFQHKTSIQENKLKRAQQYKRRACRCTDGLTIGLVPRKTGQGEEESFITIQESNPWRQIHCNSP